MSKNTFSLGRMFVLGVAISVALSGCRLSKNFHEIDPGKFYRSAQLTEEEFEQAITELQIKTIVNLRGANPNQKWYQDEMKVSEKYGVLHVDIGTSAKSIPRREALLKLLEVYRDAPRPILVHCLAGADRTGFASAIYQMEVMGKSKRQALHMLTPKYMHITWTTPAPRYFIKLYEGAQWAQSSYDPCKADYKYFDKQGKCPSSSSEGSKDALKVEEPQEEFDDEIAAASQLQ